MELTLDTINSIFGESVLLERKTDYTLVYNRPSSKDDEAFAVFDSDDNPYSFEGKQLAIPRSEAHENSGIEGVYHRGVGVFLIKEGRLYVPVRSDNKDLFPNCADISASEHVKIGENYREGALRGLREELDLNVVPNNLKSLFKRRVDNKRNREWVEYFVLEGNYDVNLSGESKSGKWISIESLKEQDVFLKQNFREDQVDSIRDFIINY